MWDITLNFLQNNFIFKFRWTVLTITIFNVKIPRGGYKLTKYAVKPTLYYVQLHGSVPVTKPPKWASKVEEIFFLHLLPPLTQCLACHKILNFPSLSKYTVTLVSLALCGGRSSRTERNEKQRSQKDKLYYIWILLLCLGRKITIIQLSFY